LTVTAAAGYASAKVYGALERRRIDALIPTKAEPIKSAVPLRRFRYDARHDIVKCPRGKMLRVGRPIAHGRFSYARAIDCMRCSLTGLCLSKGRVSKAVVIGHDYSALLGARWRRERWLDESINLERVAVALVALLWALTRFRNVEPRARRISSLIRSIRETLDAQSPVSPRTPKPTASSTAPILTLEEEDGKRPNRERENLVVSGRHH
jgi:hypothetical protein